MGRIAVLYYGNFRNHDNVHDNHMQKLINLNNCDMFIYSSIYKSNYTTCFPNMYPKSQMIKQFGDRIKDIRIYEDEADDMHEFNTIRRERMKVYQENRKATNFKDHGRCLNWLYKLYKCNQMRKSYEKANNFEYDMVIAFRPDLDIKCDLLLHTALTERRIYFDDKVYDYYLHSVYGIIDFFLFGDSFAMNHLCDTLLYYYKYNAAPYNHKPDHFSECFHPVVQILSHMKASKIPFHSINSNRPVCLFPEQISHTPYDHPNPRIAIQVIGHFTDSCETTIQNLMTNVIANNNADVFIYTSKKTVYRGNRQQRDRTHDEIRLLFNNYPNIRDIQFYEDHPDDIAECSAMIKQCRERYEQNPRYPDNTLRSTFMETMPQWYKLYKTYQMVDKYEKANDMKYSVVFKLRPDIMLDNPITVNREYFDKYSRKPEFKVTNTVYAWADVIYFTSSDNMRWLAEMIKCYYSYHNEDSNPNCNNKKWCYAHENQFQCHLKYFNLNFCDNLNPMFGIHKIVPPAITTS